MLLKTFDSVDSTTKTEYIVFQNGEFKGDIKVNYLENKDSLHTALLAKQRLINQKARVTNISINSATHFLTVYVDID